MCRCGNRRSIRTNALLSGNTKSCGCLQRESVSRRNTKHGMSTDEGGRHRVEFRAWNQLRRRCDNPKDPSYANYGGRGVRVSADWIESFANFYRDMGPRPGSGYSIERIDVNGNYCRENCKWATHLEQANNKRNNIKITFDGRVQTASQWAREIGIHATSMYQRLKKMSPEEAVTRLVDPWRKTGARS